MRVRAENSVSWTREVPVNLRRIEPSLHACQELPWGPRRGARSRRLAAPPTGSRTGRTARSQPTPFPRPESMAKQTTPSGRRAAEKVMPSRRARSWSVEGTVYVAGGRVVTGRSQVYAKGLCEGPRRRGPSCSLDLRARSALCALGGDLRYRLRARDAKNGPRPLRHPPVGVAEEFHQGRHEEGTDHGGVEDDPRREADRE
jgi:hypothetical protein